MTRIVTHDLKVNTEALKAIRLLSRGYSTIEVGDKLSVSHRTVEKWLEVLREAYRAKTTVHLVAIFFRKGIIK
jgi:DNA-binding CsgD family transcriptional regulator